MFMPTCIPVSTEYLIVIHRGGFLIAGVLFIDQNVVVFINFNVDFFPTKFLHIFFCASLFESDLSFIGPYQRL